MTDDTAEVDAEDRNPSKAFRITIAKEFADAGLYVEQRGCTLFTTASKPQPNPDTSELSLRHLRTVTQTCQNCHSERTLHMGNLEQLKICRVTD